MNKQLSRLAITAAAAMLIALGGCGKKLPSAAVQPGTEPGVPRRVMMELFTGTWCTNCPIADSAAERLARESPDSVTLVEYHINSGGTIDPFNTGDVTARSTYYGVGSTGVPHLRCDGVVEQVGSSATTYQDYRTLVGNRLLKASPCQLSLSGQQSAVSIAYSAKVTAVSSAATGGDLRLMLLVLEDSCYYDLGTGGPYYRSVVRQTVPGVNGDPLTLSLNSAVTKAGSIPIDPSWQVPRLRLAAFVQDQATKEVLQSALLDLSAPAYDFALATTDTIDTMMVDSTAEYSFTLRNTGTQDDSVWLDLPDSLGVDSSHAIAKAICNSRGICYPLPHMVTVAAGGVNSDLVVHASDFMPDHYVIGMGLTSITRPSVKRYLRFHLYVTSKK